MPRTQILQTWEPVSFPELVSRIGGGTRFTVEDLLRQIDSAEKNGESFRITHNDVNYEIPVDLIREYFADHPRPARRLTVKEELEYLRARVKELEAVCAEHGIETSPQGLKSHPSYQIPFREHPAQGTTAHQGPLPDSPPEKKYTTEEIQADLLTELRGKKPVTNPSRAPRAQEVK